MISIRSSRILVLVLTLAIPLLTPALPRIKKPKSAPATNALDDYLRRVRGTNVASPATIGSLWISSGPLATMATDYKARYPGDTIIVHLLDNFTAATNGENKQQRQFTPQSSITNLLGKLGATNRLQNLLNGSSSSSLDGKGQSTLSSNVSLDFAANIMEVLPNGMLVVQAARDITVVNDRQTVVMRGLVRPGDLAADNSIVSSAISDLEVEIKGKGAVAEITRQPNIVVRLLLRIFTF
jgi:flagellar L-ring protein precursor FlgH